MLPLLATCCLLLATYCLLLCLLVLLATCCLLLATSYLLLAVFRHMISDVVLRLMLLLCSFCAAIFAVFVAMVSA